MLAAMPPMAHASLDVSEPCRYKSILSNHPENAIKYTASFSSFVFPWNLNTDHSIEV